MSGADDSSPGSSAAQGGRTVSDLRVSAAVALVGSAVAAFLLYYNLSGRPVWAAPSSLFHGASWEEYLLVNTTALLFVPWLSVAALGLDLSEFGARNPRQGASRIAALFFAGMAPLLLWASTRSEFQSYYPLVPQAAYDFRWLVYHEITYGFYLFCWEWFFRGYLTFGLARRFGGVSAVAAQAAVFGLLHIGKPAPEVVGSFVAGVALGWLALRGRSFLPCFWVHWAVSVAFDCLVIWQRPGGLF